MIFVIEKGKTFDKNLILFHDDDTQQHGNLENFRSLVEKTYEDPQGTAEIRHGC